MSYVRSFFKNPHLDFSKINAHFTRKHYCRVCLGRKNRIEHLSGRSILPPLSIFSIKTADFQRFLSFSRTFCRFLFFAVVARPRFDPYQRNFRERRFFLPTLPVSIATLLLFFFQMAWAMNPPIRSAASLRISPVTWA